MMVAAVVILIIILTAVEVGYDVNITSSSFFLFEILKNFGRFAAELRILTYDLVECFDKRSIFGLDSTANR